MKQDLSAFEASLLAELRGVVATRGTHGPEALRAGPDRYGNRRSNRRRWAAGGGVAGVLGALVAGAVALSPTPAFSVTEGNAGTITVEVNRLEGAAALEEALAQYGVAADITYLEPEKKCAPGRYEEKAVTGLTLTVGGEDFGIVIQPGVLEDGETLVVSASVGPVIDHSQQAEVEFGVATGAVAPCRVVDSVWTSSGQ
jgi:hypothetical protein